MLSLHTLAPERRLGPLTVLDAEGFPIPWHWCVDHHTDNEQSLVAHTFVDYLIEEGHLIPGLPVAEPAPASDAFAPKTAKPGQGSECGAAAGPQRRLQQFPIMIPPMDGNEKASEFLTRSNCPFSSATSYSCNSS